MDSELGSGLRGQWLWGVIHRAVGVFLDFIATGKPRKLDEGHRNSESKPWLLLDG